MYKITLMLLAITLVASGTASAHKNRCDDGYFYISSECVDITISENDSTILKNRFTERARILNSAIDDINELAVNIEQGKSVAEQSVYLDNISVKSTAFVENHFGTHEALRGKIKMRKGTEHMSRYNRDRSGLSIYKALFELYDIFDDADLFDLSKREITSKHNKTVEPINNKLISTYSAFETAYANGKDFAIEKAAYQSAIKEAITALASIYSQEVKLLKKTDMQRLSYGRSEVIEDIREDINEDTKYDIEKLYYKNSHTPDDDDD